MSTLPKSIPSLGKERLKRRIRALPPKVRARARQLAKEMLDKSASQAKTTERSPKA